MILFAIIDKRWGKSEIFTFPEAGKGDANEDRHIKSNVAAVP